MALKNGILAAVAAFALGASAIAQDLDVFGPSPVAYEDEIKAYFAERLEDPRTARFHFVSEPYPVFADVSGYEGLPCWAVDVRVRARLPEGGFGGYMPYTVILLDGEPVAFEEDTQRLVRA